MNILLFNDNPVVRKLVALSAQKTKDELSVVWTIDEVEESSYDLLIIDDGLYSDEIFAGLKEAVAFKSTLLMATRGNAVPAGFDNVINKPFLPTDLVDMFIQIQKKIESLPSKAPEPEFSADLEDDSFSINLEEELPELSHGLDDLMENELPELDHDIPDLAGEGFEDKLDLGDLEDDNVLMNILDEEEVQEVQGLLEDTESDLFADDEEIAISGIEDIDFAEDAVTKEEVREVQDLLEDSASDLFADDEEIAISGIDEMDFSEDTVNEDEALEFAVSGMGEEILNAENKEEEDLDSFNIDDMLGSLHDDLEEEEALAGFELDDGESIAADMDDIVPALGTESEENFGEFDFDDDLSEVLGSEAVMSESDSEAMKGEDLLEEFSFEDESGEAEEESFGSEDDLENLEQKIQEAVDDLEPEDLEMELAPEDLEMAFEEDLFEESESRTGNEGGFGFDELDMLDERELKMAIGEEVEEEPDLRIGEGVHASLDAEILGEVTGRAAQSAQTGDKEEVMTLQSGSPEGVEALQALLKALSNEEVAKSLKGLNISININFGNDK